MPESDAADLRVILSQQLRAPTSAESTGPSGEEALLSDAAAASAQITAGSSYSQKPPESSGVTLIHPPRTVAPPGNSFNSFSGTGTGENDALQILLQASAAAESLQQRFSELQHRRSELFAEQQQLETDRQTFEQRAHQFAAQVAADRSAQREMQAELEHRSGRLKQQEELLEKQSAELRAAQRALSEERVILKQALKAELDEERQKIAALRQELESEREQLTLRREQDREEHATRLQDADQELRQEKHRLTERLREELSSELSQLNREKQEWRLIRDQQKSELQQQAEDLQQQREVFGEQLEAEQSRLREELEKRRQMLLTEQSNLQRRYRFQFEHLGRAREDLEIEVRELRREQQMFRAERQRFTEQHRLRSSQLEKIRSQLEAKDHSLIREARIVERSRAAAMSDIRRIQLRSEEEREAVTRDIENRQRKLRQQEAALSDLAARLEEKSQRLGRLRAELDNTQGEILEQRLAIEESRAVLQRDGSPSSEQTQARLEQTRNDVHSFFERLRLQLNTERDKIETTAAEVTERQAQFRRDRAELEQWFIDREAALNARISTSVVDELQTTVESQRQQLLDLQQRWQSDQREAERGIRELLDQLTEQQLVNLKGTSESATRSRRTTTDVAEDRPQPPEVPSQRDAA
jgi:predicted  nucleic acid-binding Zn-ribbon protein